VPYRLRDIVRVVQEDGVTFDESRGKGSHGMLQRQGY
jgi:predicted RNA binding protein YcfA (HicA-like mRNA interferase family)